MHKVDTNLISVIFLLENSYNKLNRTLADCFVGFDGSNITTNSLNARRIKERSNLESNENMIHLDAMTSIHVPLREAIDTVFRKLYEQEKPSERRRNTTKKQ